MARFASALLLVAPALCLSHGISKCNGEDDMPTFTEFMSMYARTYEVGSEEFGKRKALFDRRAADVKDQNCHTESLWWAEVNRLSDRTEEELSKLRGYKGHRRSSEPATAGHGPMPAELMKISAAPLPTEMDWKHLTAMVEVQDQGGCGSCWAFAATTVLRAHSEIYQKDHRFSVQQIVSCTPNKKECGGTGGCSGATAELAMDYVMENGCVTEEEFPYEQTDVQCPRHMRPHHASGASFMESSGKRRSNNAAASFGMVGWGQLPANEMEPLKRALVERGPVAVTVASSYSWNSYAGGIMDNCPKAAAVDHAVVLVGYGEAAHATKKYWVLQNSWGTFWGEAGFIRMIRADNDETSQCGWDTQPELGSGCNGGPSRVWVCGMCGILYDTVVPHFQGDGKRAKLMALKRREVVLLRRNRTLLESGEQSSDE